MNYDTNTSSSTVVIRRSISRSLLTVSAGLISAGILALLVFSTAAFARTEIASFGPDGTSASSFAGQRMRLAFDQQARKLYASDEKSSGIYGFDASAPPAYPALAGFAPLSVKAGESLPGLAVDSTALGSAGNLYYVMSGGPNEGQELFGASSAGTPLGGNFPVDVKVTPGPSPHILICGVAVDSAGNIWVTNSGNGFSGLDENLYKYNSAGVFQETVHVPQGRPCGIAFDSNDDLYVSTTPETGGAVWKYTVANGYTSATQIGEAGLGGNEAHAIAVDPETDQLYILRSNRVDVYNSAGALQEQFATGIANSTYSGITIDGTNHYAYIADEGNKKIHVFSAGPPVLDNISATAITNTSAALGGTVNPIGVALTDCHFEYVTKAAFGLSGFSDLSSGGSVPCNPPFGSIPADGTNHAVSAAIGGLSKNTFYRFRLVVETAVDTQAASGTFSTAGPAIVETTGSPLRTATTARLDARVDPRNAAASYHFEYSDQGPCDANPCTVTESHAAGSGDVTELVSQQIVGLQPNTTYHYRVFADNGNPDGGAFGEDMTVTTRASDASLSHGRLPGPPGSDRAYEQISSPDTGGNPTEGGLAFSDNGNRASYRISGGTPLSGAGTLFSQFFAEREETAEHKGGWRTTPIDPPRNQLVGPNWRAPVGPSDLSFVVARNYSLTTGESTLWRLSPNAPATKLFQPSLSQLATDFYATADESNRVVAILQGGELDPTHPEASSKKNLYEIDSGSPQLASLLPDGSVPACGVGASGQATAALPLYAGRQPEHWLSADGSHAFFPSQGSNCNGQSQLYVRDFDAAQTTLISDPAVSGPSCVALFLRSTPDAAFFWTKTRLASNDTVPNDGCSQSGSADGDVYRYGLADGTLDCVTCVVPGVDADVRITLTNVWGAQRDVAVAEDGSRVYFESPHSLVTGASQGAYRVNVATGDLKWIYGGFNVGVLATSGNAITPDGSVLAFRSDDPGLNSIGGDNNGGTAQYYLYNDDNRSLVCVSCPRDGSPPTAVPPRLLSEVIGTEQEGPNQSPIDDAGDLVFTTTSALVSADQNTAAAGHDPIGGTDVYEWRDGRPLLVTDGLLNWPGEAGIPGVAGFSPSGRDIFFTAAAQYTADALDGTRRLYDARIGGGFEFPTQPPPCPLEVCQGTPRGAPEEQAPGTAVFSGADNPRPRVAHKKRHKKSHHKKRQHKRTQQRANHNRRASR